jgi:hypothetical protein
MNLVEFLFYILNRNVQMDTSREVKLKDKANQWYVVNILQKNFNGTDLTKEQLAEQQKGFVIDFVRKYGEEWWVQIGLAIFSIFMVRWVDDFMHPSDKDGGDEDEDTL